MESLVWEQVVLRFALKSVLYWKHRIDICLRCQWNLFSFYGGSWTFKSLGLNPVSRLVLFGLHGVKIELLAFGKGYIYINTDSGSSWKISSLVIETCLSWLPQTFSPQPVGHPWLEQCPTCLFITSILICCPILHLWCRSLNVLWLGMVGLALDPGRSTSRIRSSALFPWWLLFIWALFTLTFVFWNFFFCWKKFFFTMYLDNSPLRQGFYKALALPELTL